MENQKIKFLGMRWSGTEWAGEEDRVFEFKVDGDNVEVWVAHPSRVKRGEVEPISVIWEGAIDFEGSKIEFKRRYPNLAKKLEEVI